MPSTVSQPGIRRDRVFAKSLLFVALGLLTPPSLVLPRSLGQDDAEPARKQPTSKERGKLLSIAKAGKTNGKEEERFFEAYVQYYVHGLVEPEKIDAKLPDKRNELKNKLLRDLSKPVARQLHDRVNQMILDTCIAAIEDAKQPVPIRYNCALMIGDLDDPEASIGGPAAVPWTAANAALMKILADPKQHPAVRVGALVGLDRELTIGLPADAQAKLAEALAAVLQSPLEEGRQGERIGQVWLRLNAANALESLADKGVAVDKGALASALAALAADEGNLVWMRCRAAGGLGTIEARDLGTVEIGPTVQALAELVVASLSASPFAKLAEPADDPDKPDADKPADKPADGRRGADKPADDNGGRGAQAVLEMSKSEKEMYTRELLSDLEHVRFGLAGVTTPASKNQPRTSTASGLYSAADDAGKKSIDQVLEPVDEAIKHLRGGGDLASLSKSVVEAQGNLQASMEADESDQPAAAAAPGGRRTGAPQGNNPATSPVRP
jgi:hypothetical protein